MNKKEAIQQLRRILEAANAADATGEYSEYVNDFPEHCASQSSLFGFIACALISIGDGDAYERYVATGEWQAR